MKVCMATIFIFYIL